jgi:UDP-N-acetylmuramate dehydrogenase
VPVKSLDRTVDNGGILPNLASALADKVQGTVRYQESLRKYGTYRIGGPAAALVVPKSVRDVAETIRVAAQVKVPWIAIGLGSNLLFDDAGFDGVVLRLARPWRDIEPTGIRVGPGRVWRVDAGFPTPQLARRTAAAGLAGVHRLVGVPGTVGGGVFMNAGAHGQEFKDVVTAVDIVDDGGTFREIPGREIAWAYRTSGIRGVIVSATFEFGDDDPGSLKREVTSYLRHRRAGTPFDQPCCGSVFRNPSPAESKNVDLPGSVTAGRLIEACGLKGHRRGGAEVSTLHANYIINAGGARAEDVKAVITDVQAAVRDRFGVALHREVKFVGRRGVDVES